jgi:hypothetical protein
MKVSSKLERTKFFIKYFVEKYEPKCYFCGEKINWEDFHVKISKMSKDNWTEHHIDGNHYNDDINNRILSHKTCHHKYHRNLTVQRENENNKKILEGSL